MKLENGVVGFEFDAKTGSLLAVEDKRTRVSHRFDPSYARLFAVCVPDEERWIDRYADSHESPRPGMSLDKGRLTIHYPDLLTPEGEKTGISATVTVTLPDGADEAMFTIEVENGGYIASSDHSVPETVSLEDFAEFVRLAKELGSYE